MKKNKIVDLHRRKDGVIIHLDGKGKPLPPNTWFPAYVWYDLGPRNSLGECYDDEMLEAARTSPLKGFQ